jgi:Ca-activated chloride channel family protein
MMRIGLQGKEIAMSERKPANLVFLVDVSGSMQASNKLGLVKKALGFLVEQLEDKDTLGIVTYSSQVKELLQPTEVTGNKAAIVQAINSLYASGGTAGGPGIQTAYAMAKKGFIQGGINRVILCTDGDFNIGLSGSALVTLVEEKRDEGITLSILGFGMGNYKDNFLEDLSNKGNGNYAYIDNQQEAEKVFGEKLLGTLQVIAKDVKIQVEFDPKTVTKYRLVGYENRLLQPKDFTDDTKDAGEIGAAHAVTAFYELELVPGLSPAAGLATVRFRYKEPDGSVSKELKHVIANKDVAATFEAASDDFRFAAAVVEFAEILRRSKHSDGTQFDTVKAIASAASGDDTDRLELVTLVDLAKGLWTAGK